MIEVTPWRLARLLQAAQVPARAEQPGFDPLIQSLHDDSRHLIPGGCFVALPGTRVDGHRFVGDVLEQGATAVIVQSGCWRGHDPRLVWVPNTHRALARLAATWYGVAAAQQADRLTALGVTGTNGKTTVALLLRSILATADRPTACLTTITNGLPGAEERSSMTTLPPLALAARLRQAIDAGATHAVIEVSSHALDQQRTAGVQMRVGVFTNLSQDHLDYHVDMPAYARTKKRLFDTLPPGGTAVINGEDDWADIMSTDCRATVLRYGIDGHRLDVTAQRLRIDDDGVLFDLVMPDGEVPIRSAMMGRHNVLNLLAAATAAASVGVSPGAIQRGIAAVSRVRGRLERVADNGRAVFVDYAHTPAALRNVLTVLRTNRAGRLICVFGCGGERDVGKRPQMGQAVAELADVAIVTSDNPRCEDPGQIVAATRAGMPASAACTVIEEIDRATAIRTAIRLAEPGDIVLIAGKGHETIQHVAEQQVPFDDVQVARAALAADDTDAAGARASHVAENCG